MLGELRQRLSDQQKKAILPVFSVSDKAIDTGASWIEDKDDWLLCKFLSNDHSRCPFRVDFGGKEGTLLLNFSVGLGAEVCNSEDISHDSAAEKIARGFDLFLRSTVHCEQHVTKRGILRAVYTPNMWVVDGLQLRFWFKTGFSWPFIRYRKEVISYQPWLV